MATHDYTAPRTPGRDPAAAPGRRDLLGAAAGALALAVTAVAVATPEALPVSHPDAALIRDCTAHVANVAALNGFGSDGPDEAAWHAYERTRDAISDAQPATMAGMVAKARAAKAEAQGPEGSEDPAHCPAGDWAWDLVHDLLRLDGEG